MSSNIFRPVGRTVRWDDAELMEEIQDRDLLKLFEPDELAEALWMQGNVERFDTAKSTILVVPKEGN